jgi:hypothetical protein
MLGVFVKAEEESIAVGERPHCLRIDRVERLRIIKNVSYPPSRIDREHRTNGHAWERSERVLVNKVHLGEPALHLLGRNEGETAVR